MWDLRERHEADLRTDALTFVLGAAGGLAIGLLLSGRVAPAASRARERAGERLRGRAEDLRARAGDIRSRAAGVASRFRPGRLRRAMREQDELTGLEDAVLDAFLADEVVGERPIDVGAISRGIIELSGSVYTDEEADRAVRLAQRVAGVETVVNRLELEDDGRRRAGAPLRDDEEARRETSWTGLQSGMGRRRQGRETDPDRPDESQHLREVALENADRREFELETGHIRPINAARPEPLAARPLRFREDELDNQEPVGPHTHAVPREPRGPDLNTGARVGEGPKPGTELRLEASDLPVKPHGEPLRPGGGEGEET